MKIGIKSKIVFIVEASVVMSIVFSMVTIHFVTKNVFRNLTYSHIQSVSVLKENGINGFLNEVKTEIEFLNNRSTVKPYLLSYISKGDKKSMEIIDSRSRDLLEYKKIFNNVEVVNSEGKIVYSTQLIDEGKIIVLESIFVNSKEKTYVQDYIFDIEAQKPVMKVGTPILDEDGSFKGVLIGEIDVWRINDLMLERSGLGKTGETFLVNSFNVVVTDLRKIPDMAMKKTIFLPQVSHCLEGNSTSYDMQDYNGDEVYGYFRWLPDMKSCLITEIDAKEAIQPINDIVILLFFVLAGGGLLSGLLGYVGANNVLLPIKKLHESMKKIKEGNFDVQTDVSSNDEIGDISKSFNMMTKELKETYGGLEEKVKEKTQNLNDKVEELQRINELMVGRELKMVELKQKLKEANDSGTKVSE